MKRFIFILFAGLLILAGGQAGFCDEPKIRVLLSKDASRSKIHRSGVDGGWVDGKNYGGELVLEKLASGKNSIINIVPLDEYVEGILIGEMPAEWPSEALKAQAVVARSYAYRSMESSSKFDVRATVEDQVYSGRAREGSSSITAVKATTGEVLARNGQPSKVRFNSTCGGTTETSDHVWGENDSRTVVKDRYCKDSPFSEWTVSIPETKLRQNLEKQGFRPGAITEMRLERFATGGRVAAVSIHGTLQTISLTGNDLRRYLGFDKLKSTMFDVGKVGNNFVFSGKGFGHGVGMCQWGTKGMADAGFTYKDILKFYYPDMEIIKVY